MTESSGKNYPVRQRGWVWRGGVPAEIEYEMGFAAEDGFPYCVEVGGPSFVTVRPASSPKSLIAARREELQNEIKTHQRVVERKQEEIDRITELAYQLMENRS